MTIKEIFQQYGPEYVSCFGDDMPLDHRKVIDAIINCRTDYYGAIIYKCEKCDQSHVVYRSCGNRHCPNCQHHKTQQWLMKQMERQVPGHHFMITFTVPEKLRRFIRGNQRVCYSAMFKTSSETLCCPYSQIPSEVWNQGWVVDCQAIGSSDHGIKYLAPYIFKVAISDSRIVKVENRKVFFKYKKPESNRWRIMNLDVMEFLRRFLQHVLPTGFMKVRYYGFLHPGSSVPLDKIRTLIERAYEFEIVYQEPKLEQVSSPTCPHCGGELKYMYSVLPFMMISTGFG